MPGIEPANVGRWLFRAFQKSEHAWLTGHFGPPIKIPGPVHGGYVFRPHFASTPTRNWANKVRRDPNGRLPNCLLGYPPTLTTSYFAPTEMQSAWATHLAVRDFYDRLNDAEETAGLWQRLRGLCFDDLEYQFRASSLVRVSLSAVAGMEEQWNGPLARKLFNDVIKASAALRRRIEAALRGLASPPSQDGFDATVARGPRAPPTREELEASLREPEVKDPNPADGDSSLDDGDSRGAYDEQLDPDSARMRDVWQKFWIHGPGLSMSCASFEKEAGAVKEAWARVPKFYVAEDAGEQKIRYLMSRVAIHLNNRFLSHRTSDLANVCQAIIDVAYPGEDRLDAASKYIHRLRAIGQSVKK